MNWERLTYLKLRLLADGQPNPSADANSILNGLFRIFVILISCTNACGITRCAKDIRYYELESIHFQFHFLWYLP